MPGAWSAKPLSLFLRICSRGCGVRVFLCCTFAACPLSVLPSPPAPPPHHHHTTTSTTTSTTTTTTTTTTTMAYSDTSTRSSRPTPPPANHGPRRSINCCWSCLACTLACTCIVMSKTARLNIAVLAVCDVLAFLQHLPDPTVSDALKASASLYQARLRL